MIVMFNTPDSPMVVAEVVDNELERRVGLSFVDELADGRGMLFMFDRPQQLRFTMENTLIPLDMIFMDAYGCVLSVEEMAEPLSTQQRGPQEDAQYVLEVQGGWANTNNVVPRVQAAFVEGDVT